MSSVKLPVWLVIIIGVLSYYGIGFGVSHVLIGEPNPTNTTAHLLFMNVCQLGFLLIPAYLYAKLANPKSPESLLGLVTSPKPIQIVLAILMLIALFPVTTLLINLQAFIFDIYGKSEFVDNYLSNYDLFIRMMLTNGGFFYMIAAALSLSITPAFCEEFFFRGYIQGSLQGKSFWIKVILAGSLFGLFHFDPIHTLGLISIGVFLSWLKEMSQSLWLPIIIHFLNNISMSIMVIAGVNIQELGKTRFEVLFSTDTILMALVGLISFFAIGVYWKNSAKKHASFM